MPFLDRSARFSQAIALAAAGALAIVLLPAQPAAAANSITYRFFGVNDKNPNGTGVGGWPLAPVGSIRLWDAGVSWKEIEVAPGSFDFTRLDGIVTTARAKRAEILLVLGQTPVFHATNPKAPGHYGPGATSMPNLTAWRNYVRKVALHYKGKGIRYQVWNEPNILGFWSGTAAQMATLTKVTNDVLYANDRSALLVAPSLATRRSGQSGRGWIDDFFAQRPTRVGYDYRVGHYIDVVSLSLYPMATGSPESSMTQLRQVKTILAKYGVNKPIWNTEINYGVTGETVALLSNARQAANVGRTYVLNAANGVKRVHWYEWDLQNIANTRMTYANKHTVSPAGRAFSVVRSWMVDARMDGCTRNSAGTYTCTITYAYGKKRAYWNPSRTVYVRTASSATWKQGLDGVRTTISGGKSLRVSYSPVVVRSRR